MAVYLPQVGRAYVLFLALLFAGGLHPTSGHLSGARPRGPGTPYYGPLNAITFNGLPTSTTISHHPWQPDTGLKQTAPEFYDGLYAIIPGRGDFEVFV
jgi:hypothetical protein